jgi:hypothetical protein
MTPFASPISEGGSGVRGQRPRDKADGFTDHRFSAVWLLDQSPLAGLGGAAVVPEARDGALAGDGPRPILGRHPAADIN